PSTRSRTSSFRTSPSTSTSSPPCSRASDTETPPSASSISAPTSVFPSGPSPPSWMPSSRLASPTSASSPVPSSSEEAAIATHSNFTRTANGDNLRGNLVGSLVLHGLVAALIVGWAFIFHTKSTPWGENASEAGAIQATMVSALPLPPKQPTLDTGVLTSDTPSPAPVVTKEKTEPPPKPDEL